MRELTGRQKLRRVAVVVLAVVALPPLGWLAYNRMDESPTPEARHLSTPPAVTVADIDNAWLVFAGLGAAPDDDPIALGRRRVDDAIRRAGLPDSQAASGDEALWTDALPSVGFDNSVDSTDEHCPRRIVSCLDWALLHAQALERLREANAVRLQRYQAIVQMRGWQSLYPAMMDAPNPDYGVAILANDLIALELARAELRGDDAARERWLRQLALTTAFWRRVSSQPDDTLALLISNMQVEAAQRLVDPVIDPSRRPVSPGMEPVIDAILQPAPVAWSGALAHEFRVFEHTLRSMRRRAFRTLRECVTAGDDESCAGHLLFAVALAPQATLNLHARNQPAQLAWLEAEPRHIDARRADVEAALKETFAGVEDVAGMMSQMGYNFAGRIMASVSLPATDFPVRVHDREALRRLIVLKRKATRERVGAETMLTFLQEQPLSLRDPYTDEPFVWDPLFGEVTFEPRATKHWKRPRVGVAVLPASLTTATDRERPVSLELKLTEHDGGVASVAVPYASCCGRGEIARREDAGDADGSALGQFPEVRVWRHGGAIGVRVVRRAARRLLAYEARLDANDASGKVNAMQPLGHEGAVRITVQVTSVSNDPPYSLQRAGTTDEPGPSKAAAKESR